MKEYYKADYCSLRHRIVIFCDFKKLDKFTDRNFFSRSFVGG